MLRVPLRAAFAAAFAVLASVAGPACAFAGLTWETREIVQRASYADARAEAVFRFTNTGTSPVTITGLSSSCGCTTAALDQRTYAAGESGEVKAVFSFEGRVGQEVKTVHVTTDDGAPPVTLTFSVTIPEAVRVTPRLLVWRLGENPQGKVVEVQGDPAFGLTRVEAVGEVEGFSWNAEEVEAGAHYRVKVLPADLQRARRVQLRLVFVGKDGGKTERTVYLFVR